MATEAQKRAARKELARRELERRKSPFSKAVSDVADAAIGAGEVGMQVASSLPATVAAGLSGIATSIPGGQDPNDVIPRVQDRWTYQPRSEKGQQYSVGLANILAPVGEASDRASETIAETTDTGAAGFAGTKALLEGVPAIAGFKGSRMARGKPTARQGKAAEAQAAGYVVDPESAGVDTITGGLGGKARTQDLASNRNQLVTDSIVKRRLGVGEDTPLSPELLAAKRSEYSAGYEAARSAGRITTDGWSNGKLNRLKQPFNKMTRDFPKGRNPEAMAFLDDVDSVAVNSFDASSGIDKIRQFRAASDKAYNAKDGVIGKAYKDLANALEETIERDLARQYGPTNKIVDDFRSSRQKIAETYTIEKALKGENIDAKVLAAELRKKVPLQGELRTIANFAEEFPKLAKTIKESKPNFSPLDLFTAGIGIGGGGAIGAAGLGTTAAAFAALPFMATAAKPLMRAYQLSGAGQRAAVRGTTNNKPATAGLLGSSQLAEEDQ